MIRAGARREWIDAVPFVGVLFALLLGLMALRTPPAGQLAVKPTEVEARIVCFFPLTVNLSAEGHLDVNGTVTSWQGLPAELSWRLKFEKFKEVVVAVDDEVLYGRAVRLMDTVRGAGAKILTVPLLRPPALPGSP